MKIVALLLSLLVPLSFFAQKTIKVRVEDQLEIVRNETYHKTEYELIQMLKEQAIKEKFGTSIYQGTSFEVGGNNENGEISGSQSYKSVARTFAKGIWVETTDKVCEVRINDRGKKKRKENWVHCRLEGKIMELTEPQFDILAEPMSCPELGPDCERTAFKNESDFFVKFVSPVDGYISTYLDVTPDGVVQALPTGLNSGKSKISKVEANKEYILFEDMGYELYTDLTQELDILYVIFSEKAFQSPILREVKAQDAESLKEGITFPDELKSKDFEKWLGKLRARYEGIQVKEILITIEGRGE